LLPLFLVSASAVGFEVALTRYFAVAEWSEYGYWVISIAMAGFALSGVALALARDWAVATGRRLLAILPPLLILAAAAGFAAARTNPFNPLQLQNSATATRQLGYIGLYYAELLPFFFLAGCFVGLSFMLNERRVGTAYGFDLGGAGIGAACVLLLMFALRPADLVPALLVPMALAAFLGPVRQHSRSWAGPAALAAVIAGEALLLGQGAATYNQFKAVFAPLHAPGARQAAEVRSPRGLYALLDDFTERADTDVSNDLGTLGLPGPPAAYGMYRDGNRVASLPRDGSFAAGYAPAALSALPYQLRPGGRVLLVGSAGGFGVAEALTLGAAHVDALETDPVLLAAIRNGLGPAPALRADPRVRLIGEGPLAAERHSGHYAIVDVAGNALDAGGANAVAYTAEAMRAYLRMAAPAGLVSIPVSIREFPVYAVRVLATARDALRAAGYADPEAHVVVYRSAWTVRILLSPQPWDAASIAAVRRWCDERSFDVSFYPGIDVAAARENLYNDLPAVSFESGEVTSGAGPSDAVADEAGAVLAGEPSASQRAFRLDPITLDQPTVSNILRLDRLGPALARLDLLPQAEIGQLVNVAVLGQAALVAVLVLLVPFAAPRVAGSAARPVAGRAGRADVRGVVRAAGYFASLGLGFLFIEIALIERASVLLDDRTSAFALVLTGMLVFSGLGSLLADRAGRLGGVAAALVALCCVLGWLWLQPLLLACLGLPWAVRAGVVVLVLAPVSLALGLPFPLGLKRCASAGLLPWAWAVNGAFSVVATPLANLLAIECGFGAVLLAAAGLYVVALLIPPRFAWKPQWQATPQLN
jgi:hypothetical protein